MKTRIHALLTVVILCLLSSCGKKEDPQNLSVEEDPQPKTPANETPEPPKPEPELKTLTDLEFRSGKYYEKGSDEPITGKFVGYHKNGKIMSESHYVNGLKDGVEIGYDPYGKKRLEVSFQNGKNHGMARNWHPNGQLMNETNFVNGQTHGLSRTWHNNGQKNTETTYNFQKIEGYSRSWHSNGNKHTDTQYRNGLKHGMYYQWNEEGTLVRQERYVDGDHVETLVEPNIEEEPTPEPESTTAEDSTPDVPEEPEIPNNQVDFIAKGELQVVAKLAGTEQVILSKKFKEGEKVSLNVKGKVNLLIHPGDNLTLAKGEFQTDAGGGSGISRMQMSIAEDGSIILNELEQ